MANEILFASSDTAPRIELTSYNLTLPMATLAIGVDNIHHDVYLSPKFVHASRDYFRADSPAHSRIIYLWHRTAQRKDH